MPDDHLGFQPGFHLSPPFPLEALPQAVCCGSCGHPGLKSGPIWRQKAKHAAIETDRPVQPFQTGFQQYGKVLSRRGDMAHFGEYPQLLVDDGHVEIALLIWGECVQNLLAVL